MPKPAATSFTASDNSAFAMAENKAKKGHRTWLLFQRKDGSFEGRIYCADAIKAAMLEVGVYGRFWWFTASSGTGNVCRSWGYANALLRAAKSQQGWQYGA
jgi:hypothetical protein